MAAARRHTAGMRRAIFAAVAVLALAGCGASDEQAAPRAVAAAGAKGDALPPLPATMRPKVVQPVAGAAGSAADAPVSDPGLTDVGPAPTGAASRGTPRAAGGAIGGHVSVDRASALANGVAVPPLEGPDEVKQIIEAGNIIARSPYVWGGGHGKWIDKGYDCSGSVSFALAAAGLLDGPLDSGRLSHWGDPGPGRWVTIYANAGHVFMEVAGVRFDTSAARIRGSRWDNSGRSTAGFAVRHPPGL
jgi:cell wall-associated NlpC family hydrolase